MCTTTYHSPALVKAGRENLGVHYSNPLLDVTSSRPYLADDKFSPLSRINLG
jgi:hypothetical protein